MLTGTKTGSRSSDFSILSVFTFLPGESWVTDASSALWCSVSGILSGGWSLWCRLSFKSWSIATLIAQRRTHRVKENRKACQSRTGPSPPQPVAGSIHASLISPLHSTTAAVRRPKSTLKTTAKTPTERQAHATSKEWRSRPPAVPISPLMNVSAKVNIRNHTPYSPDSKYSRYSPTKYGTVSRDAAYLLLTTTKPHVTAVLGTSIF